MSKHNLPPNHHTVLENAAVLQLQTFLQRRDLEAIWDAFHLLDCIHFHATSLGPSAIHSIHAALWKLIQSLYEEKRYTIVLSYCQLALHPSLTPSHNTPTFQRRLLAVLVDLGDYTDAFALFESLPASTRDDLSTRVLVFRLATRAWNQPLAQECLQFFARTDSSSSSSKEAARDALYACVREAQTAGARLCTVQALTAAAASWKGEVVVAAHVASLLRCAIRLLQAMAAAEEEGSETNAGFASSEVVALFHTAAEFVASNARDDQGDLVFPAAELRWFSTNAYNLGVVHCTLWEPGRLVSLFQSCLVFTQALSSSTSTSDDATDAADLVLTLLRCHFVLASLYISEAQLPNNEHTPSLYADVERHASAYATLFTETCGAAATSKPCPDLRQKLGVLCVFHCEALLSRQSYDHVPRIIKQAGRLCSNDVNVLKALGGCVIQSEAPVTVILSCGVAVKSSMLKSIVNEIFALENFTSDRLAQYLRCMVQVLLPMTDDSAARDILEQAVQVAHEAKQVGIAFPTEEAAWLATAAFNHGLTRYAARHDMAACRGWMDKAVAMAQHADENGQFAASMQARRQTLVDSSVAGTPTNAVDYFRTCNRDLESSRGHVLL
ncbi:Meiosis specific protein SPO22 [Beauveria brongniartii RCEF 3172]|uniref:Meiosis specific protein SPO22 n=1 Tax=Beauveria brongniartii RCEF 3172 TaxID=1081107 RepID=A0A162LSY0_9HYPO|nr:Meiosis specific protein SPO22 [Beauveria brongniartii RCEF 3172]